MLHIFIGTQEVGIFEPAVLLKRYQPGASVTLSHFLDEAPLGNNTLRSTSASTVYELHSGPVEQRQLIHTIQNNVWK